MDVIEGFQISVSKEDPNRHYFAQRLRAFYETMATQLYKEFEPTKSHSVRPNRDFLLRLNGWLECFDSEEDRWIAFRSLEYFLFAGLKEYEELYRCAVDNKIIPWLVDQGGIDIFDPRASDQIEKQLDHTWPCPITDSLRINSFLHITGIKGQPVRADWKSLVKLGSKKKIKKYIEERDIRYLVLLEDFSGSGSQINRTLKFISDCFDGPILLTPLIVCSNGDEAIQKKISSFSNNIKYDPVTVIGKDCLVSEKPSLGEPRLFPKLRSVMTKGYKKMGSKLDGDEYGWNKTGSLVVLYSNCPNNTPPIYHHKTSSWEPIFPRLDRESF